MPQPLWLSPERAPLALRRAFAPDRAGRRILCGFSFLQRIGKAATTSFWFPADSPSHALRDDPKPSRALLRALAPDWAAVLHYDIFRDANNLAIYDLEVDNLNRAYPYLMKMRGGGYRLSVITLGVYTPGARHDAQKDLDVRLRESIAQLINMMYLQEPSRALTALETAAIAQDRWTLEGSLPHVALTLGAADLFRRQRTSLRTALESRFFDLLARLPRAQLTSDMNVGLMLPALSDQRQWTYIPRKDEQFFLFQRALTDVFQTADWMSLEGLQTGRAMAPDVMPVMHHMQGHGWRLTPDAAAAQGRMIAQARQTQDFSYGACA